MTEQVIRYKSKSGRLFATVTEADEYDLYLIRLKAVNNIVNDGGDPLIRFASTGDCAEFIVRHRDMLLKALK